MLSLVDTKIKTVSQLVGSVPALNLGMQTVVERDLSLVVFDQSCSVYPQGGESPVSAAWCSAGVHSSCDMLSVASPALSLASATSVLFP